MGSIPMLNIGPQELLLVLIIGLIVVGPKRLPELSRQIGRGLREFRKLQDDVKGLVNLDEMTNEVRGMMRFDGDDANAPTASPRRPPTTATAPAVHRATRTNGSVTKATPSTEETPSPDDASSSAD
jgi:Tat protein translocase TatB subunit